MNEQTPYFNAQKMPQASDEYVAWIDIMGIQSAMMRSNDIAANFIFKFHSIVLASKSQDMTLYPVMDGVYATTKSKDNMRSFLKAVFERAALEFNSQDNNKHRFLIKASVAYGPVIHGEQLGRDASHILDDNQGYRNSILLGMPMILANQGERSAPPFGISLHYSAIEIATKQERKWSFNWWRWFEKDCETTKLLKENSKKYFTWCTERSGVINYDASRIKAHSDQMSQYLVDVNLPSPKQNKTATTRQKPTRSPKQP